MKTYTKADQQIHVLSQVIAKANRTFVPAKEDDSHTNLGLDNVTNRIIGQWIRSSKGSIILSLNLFTLDFEWLDESFNVILRVPSVCKSIKEVEQGIANGMSRLGLEPDGFLDNLHYEIPAYPVADQIIPSLGIDEINDWIYYRKLANVASGFALELLGSKDEPRIWPHHFDTGVYALAQNKVGIGFGLAMEDPLAGEAYFYIAGYPSGASALYYDEVPDLQTGQWVIGESWKGAILPISMVDNNSEAEAISTIRIFIEKALTWYMEQ